ncbi:MAG: hypothetical protein K8L91_17280 [Anaerolineae bacterium]|nr:hypothetical protein [Anaerolineae bacterium]
MRRLIRLTLTISGLFLILTNGLLAQARQQPSSTHWLILCQDDSEWGHYSGTMRLVRVSPGGGRVFPVTQPRGDNTTHLVDYSDEEWVYLWQTQHTNGFGLQTAAVFRVNRADLHEEVFGWFSVGNKLIPQPKGGWLELDTQHQVMALYHMERPNQPRQLVFQFERSNLLVTTNTPPIFSDDGQWMYFNVVDRHTDIGDVYRVHLEDGNLTNLTATVETSLALQTALLDEGWLIVQDATPTHVLYRMRLDGSELTPLMDQPNRLEWVAWLPHARLMILRNYRTAGLLALPLAGRTPVWEVSQPVIASYALPSGDILIRTAQDEIALIHPDGTRQPLAALSPSLQFKFLMQRGDWVYYEDESFSNRTTIGRINTITGRQQRLAEGLYLEVVAVSPDDTWLALSGIIHEQPGLYRLNVDGSGLVRLTNHHRRFTFMGFGPPIDLDWSAMLFLTSGAVLFLLGIVPRRRWRL